MGAGGGVQGVVDTATYLGGVVTAGLLVAETELMSVSAGREDWRDRTE